MLLSDGFASPGVGGWQGLKTCFEEGRGTTQHLTEYSGQMPTTKDFPDICGPKGEKPWVKAPPTGLEDYGHCFQSQGSKTAPCR